jgi:hypothetical protein
MIMNSFGWLGSGEVVDQKLQNFVGCVGTSRTWFIILTLSLRQDKTSKLYLGGIKVRKKKGICMFDLKAELSVHPAFPSWWLLGKSLQYRLLVD